MDDKLINEINRDYFRTNLNIYTEKAFNLLPSIDNPLILDIGCGTGVPTIELARLSHGFITAIDINNNSLKILNKKIKEHHLEKQIKTKQCSIEALDFPQESFHIIWAEGSIAAFGFEKGVKEWSQILKSDGFLVIHDEAGNIPEKIKSLEANNLNLQYHFIISYKVWWEKFYRPFEEHLNVLRIKYNNNEVALKKIDSDQVEIDMFKKTQEKFDSVYFIAQKTIES